MVFRREKLDTEIYCQNAAVWYSGLQIHWILEMDNGSEFFARVADMYLVRITEMPICYPIEATELLRKLPTMMNLDH